MVSRAWIENEQEQFQGIKQSVVTALSGATPTPDATQLEAQVFTTSAATVTFQPPKGPRGVGDKLYLVVILGGSHTLAWSAAAGGYRNGLAASGTIGQRASFEFRWDGVSWQMTGGSTAFV